MIHVESSQILTFIILLHFKHGQHLVGNKRTLINLLHNQSLVNMGVILNV